MVRPCGQKRAQPCVEVKGSSRDDAMYLQAPRRHIYIYITMQAPCTCWRRASTRAHPYHPNPNPNPNPNANPNPNLQAPYLAHS